MPRNEQPTTSGPSAMVGPTPGLARLCTGAGLIAVVFLLGICAKLANVTGWGLRVDTAIARHHRTPTRTTVATALTNLATPEIIGIGALIVLPLAVLISRRRVDAAIALCVLGGAMALALTAKVLIGEHRPPVRLWAIAADSGASYPSGHTTVAAAIAVAAVIAVRRRPWRFIAAVVGGLYALAVAASRIYLANHYPPDVIGSFLCALAAGFVVTGLAALPFLEPYLVRIGDRGTTNSAPDPDH